MSNISILATFVCQDGKRQELFDGLAPMMDHVETEAGPIHYHLLADVADENKAYMYEMYSDQAALDAHSTSDVMKQIMGAFGGILAARPELTMMSPVRGKGY